MSNRSSWIFLLAILFVSCSKSSFIEDVNRVPVYTSDIDLFYGTLDRMMIDGYYESIVQSDYFDRGSDGLKALIEKDHLNAKEFAEYMVDKTSAIRYTTLQTNDDECLTTV